METPNSHHGYGHGYANDCMSLAHQIAELRAQVGQTECGIKESILSQSLSMGKDFCDTNKNVSDNAGRGMIEILTNRYTLGQNILESRSVINEKVDREADVIKERLTGFERNVDENFCSIRNEIKDSERRILERLALDKLDEKKEIIDELRHDNRHLKQLNLFSNDISILKSMINSIEQKQEVTNKSIIFGNGSNSTTTKTNNA